jgi:hypothetical protein
MNPLVLVIVGVGVLGGGYLLYKYEQSQTPEAKLEKLAGDVKGDVGAGEGDVYQGVSDFVGLF